MTIYQVLLVAFVLIFSLAEVAMVVKLGRWYEKFYRKRRGARDGERIGPFSAVVVPAVAIVALNNGALIWLILRYI